MKYSYMIARFLSRFSKNRKEYIADYFRKKGIVIGKDSNILSDIETTESYLIAIGDNVTISSEVLLLTHDASVGKIFGKENGSDLLGKITIGDNCFIGARCTILPGVTLPNNTIVAAGSVVVKSVDKEGMIIGGNPARVISTLESLKEKSVNKVFKIHGKKGNAARKIVELSPERLIEK